MISLNSIGENVVIYKAMKDVSTFMCSLSLSKRNSVLSPVYTRFSFSSLPFLVHAPGAVQELQGEHSGYPAETEADRGRVLHAHLFVARFCT